MKKKIIQRTIKRNGKECKGIIGKEVTHYDLMNKSEGMEERLKKYAKSTQFDPEIYLSETEEFFILVLEESGFIIKKPFNYFDPYLIDGDKITFYESDKNPINRENSLALVGKSISLISEVVKRKLNNEAWDLEPTGRAANILMQCAILRSHIDKKNIQEIMRWSMSLQENITSFNFSPWEELARRGDNQSLSGKAAGIKSGEERKEKAKSVHDHVITLFKQNVKTSIISKRTGLGIRHIQNIVKPYRNK